jgi:hypothetical protein
MSRRKNTLAVVALICALVGIFTCIPAPVGAVMGHVARRRARTQGAEHGGLALAAIVVGWVGFAFDTVLVIAYVALLVYSIKHPEQFPADSGDHHDWDDVLR